MKGAAGEHELEDADQLGGTLGGAKLVGVADLEILGEPAEECIAIAETLDSHTHDLLDVVGRDQAGDAGGLVPRGVGTGLATRRMGEAQTG